MIARVETTERRCKVNAKIRYEEAERSLWLDVCVSSVCVRERETVRERERERER